MLSYILCDLYTFYNSIIIIKKIYFILNNIIIGKWHKKNKHQILKNKYCILYMAYFINLSI